jgi:predicted nucleotidyltransferase
VGTLWREIAGAPPKEGAALGSVALDSAGPESDVDLLVEFEKPVGLLQFVRLQIQLAANRSRHVDLVTRDALRPIMRPQILAEVVYA